MRFEENSKKNIWRRSQVHKSTDQIN